MKKALVIIIGGLWFLLGTGGTAEASLGYGQGYYTNLCGSGTNATAYSCNLGCNPTLGSCQSNNNGVVKWTCSGKWTQCLSSESGWDNYEDLSGAACGTTVQLSLFDKKCRRDDGTWDSSCNLLGYVVWYSGDCTPGYVNVPVSTRAVTQVTVTPTPTIKTVVTPEPTAVSKLSGLAIAVTVTPTVSYNQSVCGRACSGDNDCQGGYVCTSGVCRNPACVTDSTCFCGQVAAAAVAKTTPDTAISSWWGAVALIGAGLAGWRMRLLAKKVW